MSCAKKRSQYLSAHPLSLSIVLRVLSEDLFTRSGGNPSAKVTVERRLKIALLYSKISQVGLAITRTNYTAMAKLAKAQENWNQNFGQEEMFAVNRDYC